MSFKKSFCIWVLALGMLVSPLAYAGEVKGSVVQGEDLHPRMRHWKDRKIKKIYSQLDLSDEQRKQLDENREKNTAGHRELFQKMKAQRQALNQEFMKPELNMEEINKIQSELKALQGTMADKRLNSILEVRKILTPEQFKKFMEVMDHSKHGEFDKTLRKMEDHQ